MSGGATNLCFEALQRSSPNFSRYARFPVAHGLQTQGQNVLHQSVRCPAEEAYLCMARFIRRQTPSIPISSYIPSSSRAHGPHGSWLSISILLVDYQIRSLTDARLLFVLMVRPNMDFRLMAGVPAGASLLGILFLREKRK